MAVMVIFFFLLIFGLSFYSKLQESSFLKESTRQLKMRTVQVALKATSMPEFQYGLEDGTLDLMKIQMFAHNADPTVDERFSLYYFDVFGYSHIYINETYSGSRPLGESKLYPVYEYKPENTDYYQLIEVPVALYDVKVDQYSFGILVIKLFQR